MNEINYDYLAHAKRYYAGNGFKYMEVPWLVAIDAIGVTLPKGHSSYATHAGHLVGSGEQSFIHLKNDLHHRHGERFQTITPCFRDDHLDAFHHQHFMKLELIHILGPGDDADRALGDMLSVATGYFRHPDGTPNTVLAYQEQTDDGWDIEIGNVEVGSYGVRSLERRGVTIFRWVYGTGCAEPRLSQAIAAAKG